MTDHPIPHRPALAPRLHARLDVLLARLPREGEAAPAVAEVSDALHEVVTKIEAAEQATDATPWIVALRAAQNYEPQLRGLLPSAGAPAAPAPPSGVAGIETVWAWLITQAEFYCRLQIIHHGL